MPNALDIGIVDICFTSVAVTVVLEVPRLVQRCSVASAV